MANEPSAVHVEFFIDTVENKAKSLKEGRPIFDEKEFVRIKFPGDKTREHVAPAHEGYRRDKNNNTHWVTYAEDFPQHYEAFKAHQTYLGEGTPLSEVPFLTEARRAELRALNIHTAEHLAGLDGAFLSKLGMGGRADKDKAQAWIDKAKDSALETRLAAANAALTERVENLTRQMADIVAGRQSTAPGAASPFAGWEDGAIKDWIATHTGAKPKGNPSHTTLVATADEISASIEAKKVAA